MVVILNTRNGAIDSNITSYKITKKNIKINRNDGTYNLWKLDSFDAKLHTFIEGENRDEIFKKIEDFSRKCIDEELEKLRAIDHIFIVSGYYASSSSIEFEVFTVNDKKSLRFAFISKTSANLDCQYTIKSIEKIFKEKNLSTMLYGTDYHDRLSKISKIKIETATIDDQHNYKYNNYIMDRCYINYNMLKSKLPSVINIDESVGIQITSGDIVGRAYIIIPSRTCSDKFDDYNAGNPYSPDSPTVALTPDLVKKLSPATIIKGDVKYSTINDTYTLEGFIMRSDYVIFICKDPDGNYLYNNTGLSEMRKNFKMVNTFVNRKDLFRYSLNTLDVYFTEDLLFDCVSFKENSLGWQELVLDGFKSCNSYSSNNFETYLNYSKHLHVLMLDEIKKYLGPKKYNAWFLKTQLL